MGARLMNLRPQQGLALPLLFTLALIAFGLLPSVQQNTSMWWSFLGAGAVLFAWNAVLFGSALRKGRTFTLEIALRKQHWVQACAHATIFLYWGWYWPAVYDFAHLFVAQLLFAYAFDVLLSFSRRDTYTLGLGPFPIVLSTNLFLWFKPDWFYFQFLLVALAFAGKALIQWKKEGRSVHIFNPSAFALLIFSVVLIATGTTNRTWGPEIALTQFLPPQMYLVIFLVSLPGQLLFGVTVMTMSAAVTMYAFGLLYFAATGTYYFFGSYIPIAVFLGMHLLFTDPSTSPRTESGRIMFGMAYSLSVIALYGILEATGIPSFYDKLLPVPLLNLAIQAIDRAAQSNALKWFNPALIGKALAPAPRRLAYVSIWIVVFVVMSAAQGVGDTHRGRWEPFWQDACKRGLRNGCENLGVMLVTDCNLGSAWACNEFGILRAQGKFGGVNDVSQYPTHVDAFRRACDQQFRPACANLRVGASDTTALRSGPPGPRDYPILLLEGKGPVETRTSLELYERACRQGWMAACETAATYYARGEGTPRDPARAVFEFDKACTGGEPTACSSVGSMYRNGYGVARNDTLAIAYFTKACALGLEDACRWLEENGRR